MACQSRRVRAEGVPQRYRAIKHVRSELEVEAKLDHSGPRRAARSLPEAQALHVGGARAGGHRTPSGVVQHVQALGLEGRPESLFDWKRLIERQVAAEPVRTIQVRMIAHLPWRTHRRNCGAVRLSIR